MIMTVLVSTIPGFFVDTSSGMLSPFLQHFLHEVQVEQQVLHDVSQLSQLDEEQSEQSSQL